MTSLSLSPRFFRTVAVAIRLGYSSLFCAIASAPHHAASGATPASAVTERNEGRPTDRDGRVVLLKRDGPSRVLVAIAPHAQVFVLHRSLPGFSQHLALLREAKSQDFPVCLTVLSLSGRVLGLCRDHPPTPAPTPTSSGQ